MWFMYGIILVVRAYATAYGAPPTRAETSKLVEELQEKTGERYEALLRVVWIYMKVTGASALLLNLAALGVSDAATALLETWYRSAHAHSHTQRTHTQHTHAHTHMRAHTYAHAQRYTDPENASKSIVERGISPPGFDVPAAMATSKRLAAE